MLYRHLKFTLQSTFSKFFLQEAQQTFFSDLLTQENAPSVETDQQRSGAASEQIESDEEDTYMSSDDNIDDESSDHQEEEET